jgi:DNA-binding CsgD family transcriptional regulator
MFILTGFSPVYHLFLWRLCISGMVFLVFLSAGVSQDARGESLLTVNRDETRKAEDRSFSLTGLVLHYGKSEPVKALRRGRDGPDLLAGESRGEKPARQKMRAASFIKGTGISVLAGILLIFSFFFYRRRKFVREKCRKRLLRNEEEMKLLRRKIEDYDSLLPCNFTIKREEVDLFLKKALSRRELDVFMLLLKGFTNHKIAEHLFVSVNTVKFHLQNIYVKLDVKTRAEAVLFISKG